MTPPSSPRSGRVWAPLALLAGVAVTVGLFAAQQRSHRPRRSPGGPNTAPAAAEAHAAAGVVTGSTPAATKAYEQRLHALRVRVASEPEGRDGIVHLARLLHDGHRTRAALEHYRKAIELDPEEAQAYYDLASAHGELGEWDLAAGVLLDRLEQDAGDAVARYDLAAVRANQGRSDDARRLFEEARATTTDGALLARISDALARLKGS